MVNIANWAAILFMLIRWSNITTQLGETVSRIMHTSLYVKKNVCSMFSLKVANIVKLEAILFMLSRWSKRQNSAWEQGKSNSAYPSYAKKKSGSQLLLINASRLLHRPLFHKWL